eukprot:5584547-Pyramimonas_sp.AAC.1
MLAALSDAMHTKSSCICSASEFSYATLGWFTLRRVRSSGSNSTVKPIRLSCAGELSMRYEFLRVSSQLKFAMPT